MTKHPLCMIVLSLNLCVGLSGQPSLLASEEPAAWPQWGGPTRDFQAQSKGLATHWPQEGPRKLWSRPLGEGHSAIVSDGSTLYTMYHKGNNEVVTALDAENGKTRWEFPYAAPLPDKFDLEYGPGPDSTPALVGDRLYAVGITLKLHCLDKTTGKLIWAHDLVKDYGIDMKSERYCCSPLAYHDSLILPVGGTGHSVMAFDLKTGTLAWQKQDFEPSPCSPILIQVGGEDQLVVFMAKEAAGLNPRTGELLWRFSHATKWGLNISTPVWGEDNILFLSSAYGVGSRAIKLSRKDGKTSASEVWANSRMRVHHGNVVRIGNHVYGSTGDFGAIALVGMDVRTGTIAWRERGFAKATLVHADGKVILLDADGTLALLAVSPERMSVLGKVHLLDSPALTVPTLVGSHLYLRDRKTIMALDLADARAGTAPQLAGS